MYVACNSSCQRDPHRIIRSFIRLSHSGPSSVPSHTIFSANPSPKGRQAFTPRSLGAGMYLGRFNLESHNLEGHDPAPASRETP